MITRDLEREHDSLLPKVLLQVGMEAITCHIGDILEEQNLFKGSTPRVRNSQSQLAGLVSLEGRKGRPDGYA